MTPEALFSWLFSRRRMGVRPGIERVRDLLDRLGRPERAFRAVLVAGTNGKGSTTRALSAMLAAAGVRSGRFLSPHLERFEERIAVDGREIESEALFELLRAIRPHAEATGATFFEIATALAFLYFAEQGVELAVLEVGLGGRLDATNVKDPILSLVTALGHDHTQFLGATLAEIAGEKAGIFRPGVPALTSAVGEGLVGLKEAARKIGAPLFPVRPEFVVARSGGIRFAVAGAVYDAPLLGRHQGENLALAVSAARQLGVDEAAIRQALSRLSHPGRLEWHPPYLLDGAHNVLGAKVLARAISDHFPDRPRALVFAASRDKDHAGMAGALRGVFDAVVLTRYPGERSVDPRALLSHFPGARVVEDPLLALREARARVPGGLVVVAGSLFLVGAVRRTVLGEKAPA